MFFSSPNTLLNGNFYLRFLLSVSLILLVLVLIPNKPNTADFEQLYVENVPNSLEEKTSTSAFVSSIAILKTGQALNIAQTQEGCSVIVFTYQVTNQSTNGEVLTDIKITDPDLGGAIMVVPTGDNLNGLLEVGETWVYEVTYDITLQNIIDGEFGQEMASVSANVDGQGIQVTDFSHPTDTTDDAPTVINLSHCQKPGIGLTKDFENFDSNNDGCIESIRYIFTVKNTGATNLIQISLTDEELFGNDDPIDGPMAGEDIGNDEVLSPGEEWTYEAFYHITQADIDANQVVNQAHVVAFDQDTMVEVSDQSHPNDFESDESTITSTASSCVSEPAIALTKKGDLVDLNNNNCPETIKYTFTVINTGSKDLIQIGLIDEDLLGDTPINGPLPGQDINNDETLSVQETWVYEAFLPITQDYIDTGFVDNQAEVKALDALTMVPVSDFSHETDETLDGDTRTLTDEACVAGPSIGLRKIGTPIDTNSDDCPDTIHYTFEVQNTGTTNLYQIVITDQPLFEDQTFEEPVPSEDDDGVLSPQEIWMYEAFYPINEIDIDQGFVDNRATVTAREQGTDIEISDESHPESMAEDGDTRTITSGACDFGPAISLVKVGELLDLVDDNCPDTIQYTFVVTNTGTRDLDRVSILDNILSDDEPIDEPVPAVDENNDGILSAGGEYWVYVLLYSINQDDIDAGRVENSATVTAFEYGTNNSVSDLSDFESREEDRPTTTLLEDDCFMTIDPPTPPDGDFQIYNGLTPNDDGLNDYFRIDGIENYPNNSLKIFNRWGVLIYEVASYGMNGNLFDGLSSGRATIASEKELPSGTYYYILTFPEENPGQESYTGYLYINRE
ncbi:MAG: gliding motility-associated C-terminal domain-containing protein [Allomuricauda sp.]